MKKSIKSLLGILLMSSIALTTASCSEDNDTTTLVEEKSDFNLVASKFEGKVSKGTVTLDANTEYNLTGALIVANGAKLVIPAGTKIIGTGGTSAYIAVAQGGKIEINGTATNPVIMTGASATPGNWGGLVICGKAPINKGTSATAEVSELTYGGNDVADNSGSIKYLRIEYAGANFNSEKEFNGLSLFGVGSGTTIQYVQLYKGSDDGIEFFGGTVNTSHIISSYNEDDMFDWTEGWNGTNQNWYGVQDSSTGNRGIEADNNSNNHVATPISFPTVNNLTLVGRGSASTEPQALKLRVGTYASFDNLVLKNFSTGFDVEHDETLAAIATGKLKATNVLFENVTTKAKGKKTDGTSADASAVYTENATATGAGNGSAIPTWAAGWTIGL